MSEELPASAAIYNKALLAIYDAYVLGFSNTWVWRCPSRRILALYDRQVSGRHLEVGVGTGYFPDRCRYSVASPRIDLLDIHPATLETAARRLRRYQPRCFSGNVLESTPLPETGYGSIAVNYLLHCLPGPIRDKGRVVLEHLTPRLEPREGRLFGATILGQGVRHNALGRRLMTFYNGKGIFGNVEDNEDDLRRLLSEHFSAYELEIHGCVALFAGYVQPRN